MNKYLKIFLIIAKLSKLLKSVKFAKLLMPLATATISIAAYSKAWGFYMAAGFVGLLMVHELGHVFAAMRKKVPCSAPMFIPFVGAVIMMRPVKSRYKEAYIGFGGPLVGFAACLAMFSISAFFPEQHWIAATAFLGTFLNLFNMLPLRPLDGGRILAPLSSRTAQALGVAMLLALTALMMDAGLLLLWVLCLDDIRWLNPRTRWSFSLCLISVMFACGVFGVACHSVVIWIDLGLACLVALPYAMERFTDFSRDRDNPRFTKPLQHSGAWLRNYLLLLSAMLVFLVWQAATLPRQTLS